MAPLRTTMQSGAIPDHDTDSGPADDRVDMLEIPGITEFSGMPCSGSGARATAKAASVNQASGDVHFTSFACLWDCIIPMATQQSILSVNL